MARFSSCNWVGDDIDNETLGGMLAYLGVVEHVQQGTEAGTHSWFANPKSKASSHFGNPKVGRPDQFVDTHDKAWAEVAGNPYWLSIENEGHGEALNENQLNNAAAILVEAHKVHNVPIVNTESPNVPGHGWHGMGGLAWGGHYDCPGNNIKAQRSEINRRALALLGEGTTGVDPSHVNGATVVAAMGRKQGGLASIGPDGGVFNFNDSPFFGSMGGHQLAAPMVAGAWTPAGDGYWLVSSDGGVFAFGKAGFFGSTGKLKLNKPVVAMASSNSGNGYWMVATDGGIFAFGDAGFHGSAGGVALGAPIVGMCATLTGDGYWLVASDGGIFAYGDAKFFGSMGGKPLAAPVVGMASTNSGAGYWLTASDGGVFAFGDAEFRGAASGLSGPNWKKTPVIAIVNNGTGYDQVRVDNTLYQWV